MLPELIYREEKEEDYGLLFILGLLAGLAGFAVAKIVFPSRMDILSVVFASIPLVYPLTRFFYEDEKERAPHIPEVLSYGAIFVGEMFAFFVLGLFFSEVFSLQSMVAGVSGFATQAEVSFATIFLNNITVFGLIILVATVIGSSGAFVLTWNASVLGYFLSYLVLNIPLNVNTLFACSRSALERLGMENPSPVCYIPHSTFEMGGFVIAGVSGSLMSAAIYRQDFERELWKDYAKLVLAGIAMVVFGAFFETA